MWFYDRLNPLTHVDAYERGLAITFECGADDAHVPPDGVLRFRAALHGTYPQAAESVLLSVHPGIGHMDGAKHYAGAALPGWLREISKRYATETKKQR